jgi:hypothetical protein
MPHRNQQTIRWSLRTLCVSLPLSLLLVIAWWLHPLDGRGTVGLLMAYLFTLAVSGVAAVGAVFGMCQTGTARAFAAGLSAGREIGAEVGPKPVSRPALHLVE